MALGKIISELFYPEGIKCIVCGDELPVESRYCVCKKCKLPFNTQFCSLCGRGEKSQARFCDACKNRKWNFSLARSSFDFTGDVKNLLYRFKYGGERYLARYLGEFMADTYYESEYSANIITYVPLHKSRRKQRGYNQAALLADRIGELLGLPVFGLLEKIRVTKNLARLNAVKRQEAIKDSFDLNLEGYVDFLGIMSDTESDLRLENIKVLLVDDIFTTGATSDECAKVLRKVGFGDVMTLCCASVPSRPELI